MKSAYQILSTKKLSDLQRNLLNNYLWLTDIDFIDIEYKPIKIKNNPSVVIFTSQNAVESVLTPKTAQPYNFDKIYCVGKKTKLAIEAKGFKVTHWENYGAALAAAIINQPITEVTFFCGDIRLDEIPSKLTANKIKVNEVVVYKTIQKNINVTDHFDGIMFFSPSGVNSYITAKNSVKPKAFCIGNTTAQAASGFFKEVFVSDNPTVEDVIHKVNQYYV